MDKTKPGVVGTPAAQWRVEGQPDPHGTHYDCERASLTFGKLTDDELANAAFMNYDVRPPIQDLISGKAHMPIVYMTAVKERIRWLSRSLVKAQEEIAKLRGETAQPIIDKVQYFEIVAKGYDGESDETDDRIIWVSAPGFEYMGDILNSVPYEGMDRLIPNPGGDVSGIDFTLPEQKDEFIAKLIKFSSESKQTEKDV